MHTSAVGPAARGGAGPHRPQPPRQAPRPRATAPTGGRARTRGRAVQRRRGARRARAAATDRRASYNGVTTCPLTTCVLKFATQPYCVNVQAESFVTARGERCLCQARQATKTASHVPTTNQRVRSPPRSDSHAL